MLISLFKTLLTKEQRLITIKFILIIIIPDLRRNVDVDNDDDDDDEKIVIIIIILIFNVDDKDLKKRILFPL